MAVTEGLGRLDTGLAKTKRAAFSGRHAGSFYARG
jgi:hypothetical protein